jgi:hypothetical protein
MKKLFVPFLFAALAGQTANSTTLEPTAQRDWHFPFADGLVTIHLSSTPDLRDGKPSYILQIISGRAFPKVTDEAAFLGTVTKAMENEAMQPTRIVGLDLELREPDACARLARTAYGSAEWREAKPSNYALVIVKLLNSSDVYGAFNQVFGEYGLKIEVTGAEKIATTSPEQLGLKRNGVSRLPSGATLEMVLRPRATE